MNEKINATLIPKGGISMKHIWTGSHKRLLAAFTTVVLSASFSVAGGLYLNEFGTPAMGTAGAGAHAWANDASTSFHNAAGMTRLEGNHLMVSGGFLYASIEFDPDPSTPVPGNDGGQAGGPAPILAAFYTHSVSEKLKLGLNVISISAAIMEYDDNWTGRYLVEEVKLFTLTLNPSIAYKVNDWLSIGGGVGLLYGAFDETIAIPTGSGSDGSVNIDGDDTQVSFNLNTLFELTDSTRFGLTYVSKVEPSFDGDITLSPLSVQAQINSEIILPQLLRGSFFHKLNDRWDLVGTIGWEDWSAFENITLSTSRGDQLIPRNWDDTWHFGAGIHYRVNEDMILQTGVAYDTSPIDDAKDRTPDMPMDEQIRLAFGLQYDWTEKINIGGAFTYAFYGDAAIDKQFMVGDYKSNDLYFFALKISWKL
jgi:long-chain fatty acid transport protein